MSGRGRRSREDSDGRYSPYDKREAQTGAPDFDGSPGEDYIKVSGTSEVKTVAGKIAHSTRAGQPPTILAIGAAALNQAIKAIAIARGYVREDGWDLTVQPSFRESGKRESLALYLTRMALAERVDDDATELSVSANSRHAVVAGAIAGKTREGEKIALVSIGVDAVFNAIMAVCQSRMYLEEDKRDVRAVPEFVKIDKNGTVMSAVKLAIVAESF